MTSDACRLCDLTSFVWVGRVDASGMDELNMRKAVLCEVTWKYELTWVGSQRIYVCRAAPQRIYLAPCVYCRRYTILCLRAAYKYETMWLVGVAKNASSCFHAAQGMHCNGCCASTCRRMHSLHTLAASARFHRPAVNAEARFVSLHSLHCLSSRYFARSACQSIFSPAQNRYSNSRPTFGPF